MANKIQLIIEADDQASKKFKRLVDGLDKGLKDTDKSTRQLEKSSSSLGSTLRWVGGTMALYFGARTLKNIAGGVIGVGASFEKMEIQLNTLTKGKGKETLEALNTWAKEMPVNTEEAVQAFIRMQAMGLDPTLDKMRIMVDVSSVLGDEALPRISRALGQMAALGKLSAEELNQLSEIGINARKILKDAFGMTVEELQKSQISINEIINAIWKGLDEQYKGGAKQAMSTMQGLTVTLESYWIDFQKKIAEADALDSLKASMGDLVGTIQTLESEGTLEAWAEAIGGAFGYVVQAAEGAALWLRDILGLGVAAELKSLRAEMDDLNAMVAQGGEWTEYGDGVMVAGRNVAELELQLYYLKQRETELVQSLQDHKTSLDDLQTPQLDFNKALTDTGNAITLNLEKIGPLAEGLALYKQQLEDLKAVGLGDDDTGEGAASVFPSMWPEPEDEEARAEEILGITESTFDGLSGMHAAYLSDYAKANKKKVKDSASTEQQLQQQTLQTAQLQMQTAQLVAQTMIAISGEEHGALFYMARTFAVVQAIINSWLAYTQALAHPPGPPTTIPIAKWTLGVGLASAALIAAQTFAGHAEGGWIRGGSGYKDDVFIGRTGQTEHYAMGGEFIVNKRAAQENAGLLEDINAGRGGGGQPIIENHLTAHIVVEMEKVVLAEFTKEIIYEASRSGERVVHHRGIVRS